MKAEEGGEANASVAVRFVPVDVVVESETGMLFDVGVGDEGKA
jgi:hypothetical protein